MRPLVRVQPGGQLDPAGPAAWWHRSIASDPTATRRHP